MPDRICSLQIPYGAAYDKAHPWSVERASVGASKSRSLASSQIILLAILTLTGCASKTPLDNSIPKLLSRAEMDQITMGSVKAMSDAKADASAHAAQSLASTSNILSTPGQPSLVNFAKSENVASATGDASAQISVTSSVAVDGGNGGVSVDASVHGTGAGKVPQAQGTITLYGASTHQADIVFGSVTGAACCGAGAALDVKAQGTAGGPYTNEQRATEFGGAVGQSETLDLAIVSSRVPLLDPGRAVTALTTRVLQLY
ncbi:MAG: hypothetical protein JOY71_07605 [Acetobacteraceae bacterium]|nr:hypothetical protein [Acetobacteraceae bacterium]MBV8591230.1 hypothetical protein [Acetobacteraceae bacterium]